MNAYPGKNWANWQNMEIACFYFKIMYNWIRKLVLSKSILCSMAIHAFTFQRKGCGYRKLFSLMESIGTFFPTQSDYKPLDEANMSLYVFVQSRVDKHIKTYDASCERSFVDVYLTKMNEGQSIKGENSTFSCKFPNRIIVVITLSGIGYFDFKFIFGFLVR